jgi:hypothetical protein
MPALYYLVVFQASQISSKNIHLLRCVQTIKNITNFIYKGFILKLLNCLNKICEVFDHHIKSFDVYKVKAINDKYMIASGVPIENGRTNIKSFLDNSRYF